MPNLVNRQGPQGYVPSGEGQGPTAEQRLASMVEMMQGAPNSVLMMIARILGRDQPQARPPMPSNATPMGPEEWNRLAPMPPAFERINPLPLQRPMDSDYKQPVPTMPWGGIIRG